MAIHQVPCGGIPATKAIWPGMKLRISTHGYTMSVQPNKRWLNRRRVYANSLSGHGRLYFA